MEVWKQKDMTIIVTHLEMHHRLFAESAVLSCIV